MIVIFDASVVIDFLNPRIKGDYRAKLDNLISDLTKRKAKVWVPAPAFTEFMIYADDARAAYQQNLTKSTFFQVTPFDKKAATECALLLADAFTKNERKNISKAKFKFDWQIVATAISTNADIIYSEDADIERCAHRVNISFQRPSALPVPDFAKQRTLDLDETSDQP